MRKKLDVGVTLMEQPGKNVVNCCLLIAKREHLF